MTKPIERDAIYRGRRYAAETIELCVRWYITYRLSYRDLVAMMAERDVIVSHTTIMRWVLTGEVRQPSLTKMWDCALNPASEPVLAHDNCDPPMHQISRRAKRDRAEEFLKSEFRPVRYLRKISFGGSLNLFITPKGGRYWRYCYRYGGKRRTLSLGLYPEVPVDRARSRHLAARQLLAEGVDPSLRREELRGPFRLRRR